MCERDIYLFIFAIIPINREWLHLIASEQRQRQEECQSHVFIVIGKNRIFDGIKIVYTRFNCVLYLFVLFIFVFLLAHEQCVGNNHAGCGRDLMGFFHGTLPCSGIICVGIYIFIAISFNLQSRLRQTIPSKLTLDCQKRTILHSVIKQSPFLQRSHQYHT